MFGCLASSATVSLTHGKPMCAMTILSEGNSRATSSSKTGWAYCITPSDARPGPAWNTIGIPSDSAASYTVLAFV